MESSNGGSIRVAASADIHCRRERAEQIAGAFRRVESRADLVVLAGDLTNYGIPDEGAVLADACRELAIPVIAVLGNHDWHENRCPELVEVLEDGGITVLQGATTTIDVRGCEVGVVGVKGFVGGFPGSHLPDFGEPSLRAVYAETTAEVEALDAGLREIALCPVRIVAMHYAPTQQTLVGEPPEIWAFLGSDRLAAPILEHQPDLVVHGHAHAGRFEGRVGDVEVFNVSVAVTKRDFWLFELDPRRATTPIH